MNVVSASLGLSPGMAWAITDVYATPALLKEAYLSCRSADDMESLLCGLPYDDSTKKLPKAVSKAVAWLYNETPLN